MNNIGKLLLLAIFVSTSVFGLVGCGETKTSDNKATTNNASSDNKAATENKGTSDNKTATENKTDTTKDTTASTAESIGVAECDDFIKKYEACVKDKVPEATRAQFNSSIEQWRTSWKKLAENPQTKSTLADVCKKSLEETKKSMSSFSCEW